MGQLTRSGTGLLGRMRRDIKNSPSEDDLEVTAVKVILQVA